MARAPRLSLAFCALVAAALLWPGGRSLELSPWQQGAELASGIQHVASSDVGRALDAAIDEVKVVGRQLVKEATQVAGRVSGETAGRFLELVGANSSCAGEAAAGCRQVVEELVTQYLDVDDVSLTPAGIFEALQKRVFVHPGTKWCGAGNVSRSAEETGVLAATDACCRRHDECPENLEVGEERHGLRNTFSFTRSHCQCDREFYQCLKDTNTLVSKMIGTLYFSVLRPQCYEETYLTTRCKAYSLPGTTPHFPQCELDRSGELLWQWLDNPLF